MENKIDSKVKTCLLWEDRLSYSKNTKINHAEIQCDFSTPRGKGYFLFQDCYHSSCVFYWYFWLWHVSNTSEV